MPKPKTSAHEAVSSRVHYLIRNGSIPMPAAEHGLIVRQKFEMQALLTCLTRIYIRSVTESRLKDAEYALLLLRVAEESCFESVFEKHGYPDELEAGPDTREWLALSEACGFVPRVPASVFRMLNAGQDDFGRSYPDCVGEDEGLDRFVRWRSRPEEIEVWRSVASAVAMCS